LGSFLIKHLPMANTYTQLYVHVVFSVKGRASCIGSEWKENLYRYITGLITHKEQRLMIVNGVADHIHLLIGLKPDCNLSDLVRDLKANSSRWINENKLVAGRFAWQTGFGAFSVGQSQLQRVVNYILNQEDHHLKKSFREEYIEFLDSHGIVFRPEYLFDDYGAAPTELK
jgi:putative transposase